MIREKSKYEKESKIVNAGYNRLGKIQRKKDIPKKHKWLRNKYNCNQTKKSKK